MRLNETRVVSYTMADLTRDEYLAIAAGLSCLIPDDDEEGPHSKTARALLRQMGEGVPGESVLHSEPERGIRLPTFGAANDDVIDPVSDEDPRPRASTHGITQTAFRRQP